MSKAQSINASGSDFTYTKRYAAAVGVTALAVAVAYLVAHLGFNQLPALSKDLFWGSMTAKAVTIAIPSAVALGAAVALFFDCRNKFYRERVEKFEAVLPPQQPAAAAPQPAASVPPPQPQPPAPSIAQTVADGAANVVGGLAAFVGLQTPQTPAPAEQVVTAPLTSASGPSPYWNGGDDGL